MVSSNKETHGMVKNALIGSPRPESIQEENDQSRKDTGKKNQIMRKLSQAPWGIKPCVLIG